MINKTENPNSVTQTSSPLGVRGMFHGASNLIFENARELRNKQTESEIILWNILKDYKLRGFKFRRQHPIANYIADFYCHKAKLIIEIDGEYHNNKEQVLIDKERTAYFNEIGLQEIRFTNNQVLFEIEIVLNKIDDIIGLKNELIQKELQIIPFKNFPIKSTWHLIWMKNKNLSPVANSFLNYVKKEKQNIITSKFDWCDEY